MKNRKAKKGFTIIELVIVIAVIGILAGVLIPTFSNVIANANKTAAMENAKNAYTNYLIDHATDAAVVKNICIESNGYYFKVVDGQFYATAYEAQPTDFATGSVHWVVEGTEFKLNGGDFATHTH